MPPGAWGYVWQGDPGQTAPHGMFTVRPEAIANGAILPNNIFQFAFSFPLPARLYFHTVYSGALVVDKSTGRVLDGSLCAVYTDHDGKEYGCQFGKDYIRADGHVTATGRWSVTQIQPATETNLWTI